MLKITQTLVSNFEWIFKKEDGYEEFLKCLNREKSPPTEAQLEGRAYEEHLNCYLNGIPIPLEHKWYDCLTYMEKELGGAAQQVALSRPIVVDGEELLVYGILDYLLAGHIYDCKFSKRYGSNGNVNAYRKSPQAPFYFYLVPEARDFTYFISDGNYVYRETYTPDEVVSIENTIHNFLQFLRRQGLYETYKEKWRIME